MTSKDNKNRGPLFALVSAALFGAGAPAAKYLLADLSPLILAGLLYLGAGIGLGLIYLFGLLRKNPSKKESPLRRRDLKWLAGSTLFGGILGPVFLLIGISKTDAASASLFLNIEGLFTAVIAWLVFKEHFDRKMALGLLLILGGGIVLSWDNTPMPANRLGPLLIALACLCWGIDNNLTKKIADKDPVQIAVIKSLLAGVTNFALAFALGKYLPEHRVFLLSGVVGFVSYGLSLLFFILSLRHIGAARTGAYFSTAPFVGAALSLIFLGGSVSLQFAAAGILMAVGVWCQFTEKKLTFG